MTVAQVVYDTNGAPKIQDAGSSFTKGISTFDTESAGFKALVKCSTLCNTCNFDKYFEDEVTGKRVLLPFSKVRVQGDGSTITEILWKTRGNASEGAMIKFAQGGCVSRRFEVLRCLHFVHVTRIYHTMPGVVSSSNLSAFRARSRLDTSRFGPNGLKLKN